VTVEYQRSQAKAMQQYFRELKEEETAAAAQVFGWTRKNEISNGRWVMMGLAIGILTEYATGVSFPDQLRLMVSYLGIWDLDY
jgi:predicted acyl esterase